MKIIYLHQYYNNPSMSGGTRSYELARRLAKKGHEVHVVTSWRSETLHSDWFVTEEAGFTVHWLPVKYCNHMNFTQRLKAFLYYALKAGTKARKIGGDLVLATSTPLTIALPGVSAANKLGVPLVFEVRDLWPELPIAIGALKNPLFIGAARWLERYAYRHAAHIIALSPGIKKGVAQTGYPAGKITIIPNSADLSLFAPEQAHKSHFLADKPELTGKKLIVYCGTFGLINGLTYAVEMAEHLAPIAPEVALVLVGEGIEKKKWSAYQSKKNFWDKIFSFTLRSQKQRSHTCWPVLI